MTPFTTQNGVAYITRWWRTHGILTIPAGALDNAEGLDSNRGWFRFTLHHGRSVWLQTGIDLFVTHDEARGDVIRRKAVLISRLTEQLNEAYDIDTVATRSVAAVNVSLKDCIDAERG